MTGLRKSFTGWDATPPGGHACEDLAAGSGMAELHESIAGLLAARGQWKQAYHHLRSALDLMATNETPRVPEQLRHEVNRLRREHAEAREQSLRDSLTACYNRRYLDQRLPELLTEPGTGIAVALCDLDWFKRVNDQHGHLLGDRVLKLVVELLQEVLPGGGFCARYGGEEFVLVSPDITATDAVDVCESARQRVEQFPWSRVAPGLCVTISIGVVHEDGADAGRVSAQQQLINADALLYAAKRAGRNVVAYRKGTDVRFAGAAAGRSRSPERRAAGY